MLWLVDNFENMDIRCVRLQPFRIGERVIVSSEVIIPLPEAEQYRLSVQRKRREVIETQAAKAKSGRLVPRLLEAGALSLGDTLYFKRSAVPGRRHPRRGLEEEPLYRAELATAEEFARCGGPTRTPLSLSSFRPLCLPPACCGVSSGRPGPVSSEGINGMLYWTTDGTKTLRDLAAERAALLGRLKPTAGGQGCSWRQLCSTPSLYGRWTTYGDIAAAIGVPGAAQSVAGVIAATEAGVKNAHRVLRANSVKSRPAGSAARARVSSIACASCLRPRA